LAKGRLQRAAQGVDPVELAGPDEPGDGPPRLSDVLEIWLGRVRVPEGAEPGTTGWDRSAVARWAELTGDPPVAAIDADLWARFVEQLREYRGRSGRLSSSTVRTTCVHLAAILRYGLGSDGRRDGLGLGDSFYLPIPTATSDSARTPYSPAEIDRLLEAADGDPPQSKHQGGIPPRVWWRSLLLLAYNTGLRPISLFRARREWIGRKRAEWLWLPPAALKRKREPEEFYLNPAARAAIEALGGPGDGLILRWAWTPSNRSLFYRQYDLLERSAGVAGQTNNRLRRFRQYLATWLAPRNLAAARLVLGHTAGDVLLEHYARRYEIVPPVLDQLPQPGTAKQRHLS